MQHAGLKTATVVGHGSSGGMGDGMSVRQQKRVLEEIKQFMYQVRTERKKVYLTRSFGFYKDLSKMYDQTVFHSTCADFV